MPEPHRESAGIGSIEDRIAWLFAGPQGNSGIVAPGHLLNSSLHGPRWLTGGKVGPEASVACFVVISLMFLVFHFVYPAERKTSAAS